MNLDGGMCMEEEENIQRILVYFAVPNNWWLFLFSVSRNGNNIHISL